MKLSITRPILKLQPSDFHGNRYKWNVQDDDDDDDDNDDDDDYSYVDDLANSIG